MSPRNLELAVKKIGRELVACTALCEGIFRAQNTGVMPRCLILERSDAQGMGCLAAGINPARSSEAERAYYRLHGPTYDSVVAYWREHVSRIPYYQRLRRLIDQLHMPGPILWSDLAKCENAPDVKSPIPLQTLRRCSGRFLYKEIRLLPKAWPILAVGIEAYKALAYMVPERTVIGVPHPTGSRGQFFRLFNGDLLWPDISAAAHTALLSAEPVVLWLQASR